MNVLNKGFTGGFQPVMDHEEAKLILGLEKRMVLRQKLIQEAYVKMITFNHHDKGGSVYLAQKIMEAKKILSNATVEQ